jgi:hypothetical protein
MTLHIAINVANSTNGEPIKNIFLSAIFRLGNPNGAKQSYTKVVNKL